MHQRGQKRAPPNSTRQKEGERGGLTRDWEWISPSVLPWWRQWMVDEWFPVQLCSSEGRVRERGGARWGRLPCFPLICVHQWFCGDLCFQPDVAYFNAKENTVTVPPISKISPLVALLASWGLLLILIMRSGDCEAVWVQWNHRHVWVTSLRWCESCDGSSVNIWISQLK